MLGSGARVADDRHDIGRWNAKLAADSCGERSADPLPHLVPADDDEYAAIDGNLEPRDGRYDQAWIGADRDTPANV